MWYEKPINFLLPLDMALGPNHLYNIYIYGSDMRYAKQGLGLLSKRENYEIFLSAIIENQTNINGK